MCDFIPSSCFRKVIGRMRRVSAISDYLKSKRKGKKKKERKKEKKERKKKKERKEGRERKGKKGKPNPQSRGGLRGRGAEMRLRIAEGYREQFVKLCK